MRHTARAEDEPDMIPLSPRVRPFDPERYHPQEHILPPSTFHHFMDFARRAPADLLLRESESHLSYHAREVRIFPFHSGIWSIIAREWYMELPDAVRQIVDEAGFGPFCVGLSRLQASRTLMGALVERLVGHHQLHLFLCYRGHDDDPVRLFDADGPRRGRPTDPIRFRHGRVGGSLDLSSRSPSAGPQIIRHGQVHLVYRAVQRDYARDF
ncbi:hypothetical protein ACSBR2_012337 [Camellia fascicularis]